MTGIEGPHPGLNESHWLHPLIEQEGIDSRIDEMARAAADRYKNENVIFLRISEGGDKFANQFEASAKKYGLDFESGSITVKSMIGTESNGTPEVKHKYEGPDMKGRKVLLLEDIVDTGETVDFLLDLLAPYAPSVINAIVLFMKTERRKLEAWNKIKDHIDDVGFDVFGFVVGFNIDWDDYYRQLEGLWLVKFKPKTDKEQKMFDNPKMPKRLKSKSLFSYKVRKTWRKAKQFLGF